MPSHVWNTMTIQQTQLSSTFTNRIAIAFLGAAYAFLDGLVHLTSSDLPVTAEQSATTTSRSTPSKSFDFRDVACTTFRRVDNDVSRGWIEYSGALQLRYLSSPLISNMMSQLESISGTSTEEDRKVLIWRRMGGPTLTTSYRHL
ncbi:hypothetical protein F5141DRAFT_1049947 [Pisolithus sp. B1]|nr:hypothetical protein F5141DRAFT_1049947 [Pisolithus sp. B1]